MADARKLETSKFKDQLEGWVKACESIRRDTEDPQDITLSEFLAEQKEGLTMDQVYEDLGLNPMVDTISNMINLPSNTLRWLIPEIFRDALRLGLRKGPLYPQLIVAEQSVKQTTVTMPAINMSEATPKKVGIAETITTGEVSFDQKSVKIYKYGRGIKVPYEVIQYVPLNLVAIWLQDFGVKMAMGLDAMCMSTILNGDQAAGSDSVAVVGITTANTLVFRDLLRVWVRGGRLGKDFSTIIAGEIAAMDILDLLTNARTVGAPRVGVSVKTPIPQNANILVHGSIPAGQMVAIDPTSALIKLNAQPLLVETEKMVANQTEATYCSFTTGFATIFRDSRLSIDTTKAFGSFGFPTWMDPTAQETFLFD